MNLNKKCTKCGETKPVSEFHKQKSHNDGINPICKKCITIIVYEYLKTKNGLITQIYSHQKQLCKRRGHLPLNYSKQELQDWLFAQPKFYELFDNWVNSGYNIDLKLSIDRIDNHKSYSFDNIQLMTWRENNEKGNLDMKLGIIHGANENKAVLQMDYKMNIINEFISIHEASRNSNISFSAISKNCNKHNKSAGGFIWKFKNND